MPKSTLTRLKYQGTPVRPSNIIVKEFDGSRKSVIGEIDLPIWVGPHMFQITFQIMDIKPAYSCLLGRPWIHEAGAVTSTLHQKLKFVRNGAVVVISGEQAMLISNLSSFTIIEADESEVGTHFQALTVEEVQRSEGSIASFKDAQQLVKSGPTNVLGKIIKLPDNKHRAGLGFSSQDRQIVKPTPAAKPLDSRFHSGGFAGPRHPEVDAILGDGSDDDDLPNFVTPGVVVKNWTTVNIPSCIHVSK